MMSDDRYAELCHALKAERDAEEALEKCRRRVRELAGLAPEKSMRKSRPMSDKEFLAAAMR